MFPHLRYWLMWLVLPFALRTAAASDPLEQCDPKQVVSAERCGRCHTAEVSIWKKTPHFQTFDQLHRKPAAKEIAARMGITSIKRSGECIGCHYTPMQQDDGQVSLVSGVSCESCHGGAKNWINIHSDYGGPGIKREQETDAHRAQRIHTAIAYGMRNPRNPYLVARSCLNCHTVPNEKLVNVGGHAAGSKGFELVAWSQGSIKHNFISNNGVNQSSDVSRQRTLYIAGLVAELEFATRAVSKATTKERYGLESAERAAQAAIRLRDLQAKVNLPLIEEVLAAFAEAELRTRNRQQLLTIADRIKQLGERLGAEMDGDQLAAIDSLLPTPQQYK